MSQTPDSLLREWFDHLWVQGREDTIDRLLAPDAPVHGLSPDRQPLRGPDQFKMFYRRFRAAFPDMRITVERSVREGDLAVVYCRASGTHTGEGLGMPASGKAVDFEGMVLARTDGTRIVEAWNCVDFLGVYQQIGAIGPLTATP